MTRIFPGKELGKAFQKESTAKPRPCRGEEASGNGGGEVFQFQRLWEQDVGGWLLG